ncbi:MAG: DoxX family membrane protein [Candidatus Methylopumilus sp.]|jgi:putative oxidoreductase|nr:DoxX family membrane protein [Candidatus Methylopumilus sp.]
MNKYLSTLGRVLLAQLFLLQVIALIIGFFNSPSGYLDYQNALGHQGLPGIFAPLIILVQLVGGIALMLGFKTKPAAIAMAIYAIFISFALGLSPFQYLAIVGGLLTLAANPTTAFSLDNLKK